MGKLSIRPLRGGTKTFSSLLIRTSSNKLLSNRSLDNLKMKRTWPTFSNQDFSGKSFFRVINMFRGISLFLFVMYRQRASTVLASFELTRYPNAPLSSSVCSTGKNLEPAAIRIVQNVAPAVTKEGFIGFSRGL